MGKKNVDPWQAEDDARTLKRAAEIQADKGRVNRATKILHQERKAIDNIVGKGGKKK
jgi:hypothetical protein